MRGKKQSLGNGVHIRPYAAVKKDRHQQKLMKLKEKEKEGEGKGIGDAGRAGCIEFKGNQG